MPLTPESFAVGKLFVSTSIAHRTDGLVERQVLLVRITSNDSWNALWEVVALLWGENVLHQITGGGTAVHAQALAYLNNKPPEELRMNPIDEDFVQYCRTLTDAQLESVLLKEWEAPEHRDYGSAVVAAAERGWYTVDGKRQN
jgi:hypothetical protein